MLILALAANVAAAGLLAATIFFYVVVYTMWLKRRTPQYIVIGGAAGACPPLIGWLAAGGELALEPVLLALIIFLWMPPHFWALSLNRAGEYARAGVPMLPVVAGSSGQHRPVWDDPPSQDIAQQLRRARLGSRLHLSMKRPHQSSSSAEVGTCA